MSKTKFVVLIILILFLLPEIGDHSDLFDDNPYAWRFWNFWYSEGREESGERAGERICFSMMPVPKYSYSYRSMFVDIRYHYDYCEDYEWWQDKALSLFLGVEYWGDVKPVYLPVFWISISDVDVDVSLFGQ